MSCAIKTQLKEQTVSGSLALVPPRVLWTSAPPCHWLMPMVLPKQYQEKNLANSSVPLHWIKTLGGTWPFPLLRPSTQGISGTPGYPCNGDPITNVRISKGQMGIVLSPEQSLVGYWSVPCQCFLNGLGQHMGKITECPDSEHQEERCWALETW